MYVINKFPLILFNFVESVFAGAGVSDYDVLLRWLRLHDDAAVPGRDPDLLQHSPVHTAYETDVPEQGTAVRPGTVATWHSELLINR